MVLLLPRGSMEALGLKYMPIMAFGGLIPSCLGNWTPRLSFNLISTSSEGLHAVFSFAERSSHEQERQAKSMSHGRQSKLPKKVCKKQRMRRRTLKVAWLALRRVWVLRRVVEEYWVFCLYMKLHRRGGVHCRVSETGDFPSVIVQASLAARCLDTHPTSSEGLSAQI